MTYNAKGVSAAQKRAGVRRKELAKIALETYDMVKAKVPDEVALDHLCKRVREFEKEMRK